MIHIVDCETLKQWIASNQVNIIDVREQSEYNETNIDGSTLIPLGQIDFEKVQKIANNGKKTVIHCRSGARSLKACQILMEYDESLEVYNLEGGIIAWNNMNKSCQSSSCSIGGCNVK